MSTTTPPSATVIKDKETSMTSAMSVSPAKMTPVSSSMSVEAEECLIKPSPSVSSSLTMSVTPDTVISAAHVTPDPSLPPEIVVKSPASSDEEMEDLSRFQLKWAPFNDPLSPMSPSVSLGEGDQEGETVPLPRKILPPRIRKPVEKKGFVKTLLPMPKPKPKPPSSEEESVFKQPLAASSPSRPVSLPSSSLPSTSSKLSSSPQHSSLENLSSLAEPVNTTVNPVPPSISPTTATKTVAKAPKSKGLDSILNSLGTKGKEASAVKVAEKAPALPPGPYPRRRGRKSAGAQSSARFNAAEEEEGKVGQSKSEPAVTSQPAADTPTKRGRGRPPKPKPSPDKPPQPPPAAAVLSQEAPSSTPTPASSAPPTNAGKVVKQLPPGCVPCHAPPPGTKVIYIFADVQIFLPLCKIFSAGGDPSCSVPAAQAPSPLPAPCSPGHQAEARGGQADRHQCGQPGT